MERGISEGPTCKSQHSSFKFISNSAKTVLKIISIRLVLRAAFTGTVLVMVEEVASQTYKFAAMIKLSVTFSNGSK